jgi:hypothetical protein
LGELVELRPSGRSGDVSWEAYTLPIKRPGVPHVLEVEYPSDVPQMMGISILEPNAAGAIMPIQLDSGIDTAEDVTGLGSRGRPRMLRHRLIFWPRTKAPMVLITNHRHDAPAVYGKIRVLAGWEHLPRAFPADDPRPQRLLAAYMDRPLFPESFCASEGGTRLVEYLHHVGMGGLMISVLADGGTIYPSRLVQPTPRYDKGVFFATGQDPVPKDVLEMLFRLFDRSALQLIPALEFAAPLPELEALLRRGGPRAEGIRWIGPEGLAWQQVHQPRRRMAPYYNVLHPRVQEAMLAVVRELVETYAAEHESFAGLAIQLSAYGYAQLPGPQWGMDDATIGRFERDTGIRLPGGLGSDRFAKRERALAGPFRRQWLQWRADQLSRFYRRMHAEIEAVRPGAVLYLAGANMLTGEELEYRLRPALPRRATMADILLQVGIDASHYERQRGLVLLRPRRIAPLESPAADATNLEISQLPDLDRYFQRLSTPGSLFFHQPRELRVASFDPKSPYRPSYVSLASQLVPSGDQNRRRFVHSLATLDAQVIFDGGWLMPLGQQDSLRELVAAYRRLPAIRFKRLSDSTSPSSSQPVTIRHGTHAGQTYVYAVNDGPTTVTATVRVEAPGGCRLEELTGTRGDAARLQRDGEGTYWQVELRPYDLVAVRLSAPSVKLSQPRVTLAEEVYASLNARIRDLGSRAASLRSAPPLEVLANPAFEKTSRAADRIPGWTTSTESGASIQLIKTTAGDDTRKPPGTQSVRLQSSGPVASLVSRPFSTPRTGRLSIFAWLRVPDASRQPMFRLALTGKQGERSFTRIAIVGNSGNGNSGDGGSAVQPIKTEWAPYVFPVDDLPLDGLSQLQVRFDLIGPGEVWVDDVQLYHLDFLSEEHLVLAKLITLAHVTLENGRLGDCIHLLEGYWPRFLEANVPLSPSLAHKPSSAGSSREQAAEAHRSTGLLEKMKGLMPKKFW